MDNGVELLIKSALPPDCANPAPPPISFIENKPVNLAGIEELLRISEHGHRWANFGPVSQLLEAVLERYLRLPSRRSVVFCSSATAALFAMIATREYQAQRPLRWVTSAYSFYSSWLGPLSRAVVVDCDAQGMLNFDQLEVLDAGSFDGVLVTNIFGVSPDLRRYIAFCRAHKKHLIVDNAAVLDGFPRENPDWSVDEIISFHQTKPWGMGEGGCAIVDSGDAVILRAMTNFGVGLDHRAARGAGNSKISDFSCALILNRLREISQWRPGYKEQARRIYQIAKAAGLETLAPMDLEALTPPHIPVLYPGAVPYAKLSGAEFAMQKYYLPHPGDYPQAQRIYSRIVNIPCHPGMSEVSDAEIWDGLCRLTAQIPIGATPTG
jgi:dTDP-4-amino-4,6-dideoxygalactose transaminase